eukprot:6197458-Pleurochrysis_carterae.AAC.1
MTSPILQNGRLFWRMVGTLRIQCEGKRLYRMVTAFCRMVNTILQNSLYSMFRYGEQVILQNGDSNAT